VDEGFGKKLGFCSSIGCLGCFSKPMPIVRKWEHVLKGYEYASKSQKPCRTMIKIMIFFTYVFFLTF
jgi:hypothetical protein